MWNMFEDFDMNCGDCEPPPFLVPAPPRPPFLELAKCTEDSLADIEVCMNLDGGSYFNSYNQTSAMLLLAITLFIIFFMLVFLLMWMHKRKVQNFPSSPSKTPTRANDAVVNNWAIISDGAGDDHLGHRPLVMRHPCNIETLQAKIHYPSGYPMPRSPPLFICSSPGPDPYDSNSNSNLNSNQNIYEELDNNRMESDDDSTVPCESFNKSSSENTTVASIYQAATATEQSQVERPARQYLEGASTLTTANNHSNHGNFRYKTETKKNRHRKSRINTFSMDNLKNPGETSLPPQLSSTYSQPYQTYCINSDLNRINNNFPISTNSRKCCTLTNPSQMEIERRNRINMLFNAQSNTPVVHMNHANHFDGINNNSQHVYEDTVFYDSNRPNILPDFTTIRNYNNFRTESPSFGRDSSFSGDSGYSQNSNRSYFGRRKV